VLDIDDQFTGQHLLNEQFGSPRLMNPFSDNEEFLRLDRRATPESDRLSQDGNRLWPEELEEPLPLGLVGGPLSHRCAGELAMTPRLMGATLIGSWLLRRELRRQDPGHPFDGLGINGGPLADELLD